MNSVLLGKTLLLVVGVAITTEAHEFTDISGELNNNALMLLTVQDTLVTQTLFSVLVTQKNMQIVHAMETVAVGIV